MAHFPAAADSPIGAREHDQPERLTHPQYRAGVDGLRAIAVLSVVGFHAFPGRLAGGFIGERKCYGSRNNSPLYASRDHLTPLGSKYFIARIADSLSVDLP